MFAAKILPQPDGRSLVPNHPSRMEHGHRPGRASQAPHGFVVEAHDREGARRHAAAWDDLVSRGLEPNPFMDPGFCLPAAHHLASGASPLFLLVWDRGGEPRSLVAVCVLEGSRMPFRPTANLWFHDLAAFGGPLLDRDAAKPALLAFLDWIGRHRRTCAAVQMTALNQDGPTHRLLAEIAEETGRRIAVLDERRRAVLPGDHGMPAGLAAVSGRRAKELRRQHRRLHDLGTVRFESTSAPDAITPALERFLDLEAAGWKGKAETALRAEAGRAAFVREMVTRMAAKGRCRIDTLWLDDRPIAMGILLAHANRHFFWKTAYAEDLGALSPGVQFVLHLTETQRSQGVALTDSCAVPDHPMIDRLWPDRLALADVRIASCPGTSRLFGCGLAFDRVRRSGRARLKSLYLRWRARA